MRVMLSFCFLIFQWRVFLIAIKVSEKRCEIAWGQQHFVNIEIKVAGLIYGDLKQGWRWVEIYIVFLQGFCTETKDAKFHTCPFFFFCLFFALALTKLKQLLSIPARPPSRCAPPLPKTGHMIKCDPMGFSVIT